MFVSELESWLKNVMAAPPDAPLPAAPDLFPVCIPFTLSEEAPLANTDWGNPKNFSDDPHDPGGATMDGLTQSEFSRWLKAQKLPDQNVRNITKAQGLKLYHDEYWEPYCPRLFPGLNLSFFDSSVNEGQTEAIKILQFTLKLSADGVWGKQTDDAVQKLGTTPQDYAGIVTAFAARREWTYQQMKAYRWFGRDWDGRTSRIKAASLTMAQAIKTK